MEDYKELLTYISNAKQGPRDNSPMKGIYDKIYHFYKGILDSCFASIQSQYKDFPTIISFNTYEKKISTVLHNDNWCVLFDTHVLDVFNILNHILMDNKITKANSFKLITQMLSEGYLLSNDINKSIYWAYRYHYAAYDFPSGHDLARRFAFLEVQSCFILYHEYYHLQFQNNICDRDLLERIALKIKEINDLQSDDRFFTEVSKIFKAVGLEEIKEDDVQWPKDVDSYKRLFDLDDDEEAEDAKLAFRKHIIRAAVVRHISGVRKVAEEDDLEFLEECYCDVMAIKSVLDTYKYHEARAYVFMCLMAIANLSFIQESSDITGNINTSKLRERHMVALDVVGLKFIDRGDMISNFLSFQPISNRVNYLNLGVRQYSKSKVPPIVNSDIIPFSDEWYCTRDIITYMLFDTSLIKYDLAT